MALGQTLRRFRAVQITISASARFAIASDGTVWAADASAGYPVWARYLGVFERVRLLVRARAVDRPDERWGKATGDGVCALALPHSAGMKEFLLTIPAVRRIAGRAMRDSGSVCLRLPCPVGEQVWRACRNRRPYAAEVIGDPQGVFAPRCVGHPFRPLLRCWFVRTLRAQCAGACAVAYVTQHSLRRRYPSAAGAFGTHYSDVDLPPEAFRSSDQKTVQQNGGPVQLVTVASLAQPYKGVDVLIDAVAQCRAMGTDLRLVVVGEGRCRKELEDRVRARGLAGQVAFRGRLATREAVRAELDQADVFVLASREDSMPRALLEAMARAMPCIASAVGGVPELLAAEDLVPPRDARALAEKIRQTAGCRSRMAEMSRRNLAKAVQYRSELLQVRRVEFLREVRDRTEAWLRGYQETGLCAASYMS